MTDLWTMAGEEAERDAAEHKLALARVACANYWPVLASADDKESYEHAKALISEGVTASVADVAVSPADQAILASLVLDSFDEDWDAHQASVQAGLIAQGAFTRQHYEAIAQALHEYQSKNAGGGLIPGLAEHWSDRMAPTSSLFNKERFLHAATQGSKGAPHLDMPMMTQDHYDALADAIASSPNRHRAGLADHFSKVLKNSNVKFKPDLFMRRANPTTQERGRGTGEGSMANPGTGREHSRSSVASKTSVVEDAPGYANDHPFGLPAIQDPETDEQYQAEIDAWEGADRNQKVQVGNGIGVADDSSGPNVMGPGMNQGEDPLLHASALDIEAGLEPGDYRLDAFGALIRVALKMSPEHVDILRKAIEPHDTPENRARYSSGDYPRSDRTKDPDTRYRWDLLYHSKGLHNLPDDHGYNDNHIDSALKTIVPPLSSKQSAVRRTAEEHAPYYVRREGDRYKVVNRKGDVKGTFNTKEEARSQQKALYANVPGAPEEAKKHHGETPKAVEEEGKKASLQLTALQRQAVATARHMVDEMPLEAEVHAIAKAMYMRAKGFDLTSDETDLVVNAAINRANDRRTGGSLDFTKQAAYDGLARSLHGMNHGDRSRYESEGHPFEVSYHERPAYGDMGQPVERSDKYSGTTGEYTLYHPHGQAQEFHVGPSNDAKGYQAEKVRDTMMDHWSRKKMNRMMGKEGVSEEKRDRDEKAGDTLPGTDKFPISNATDLENAKHDIGRTSEPHDKVVRYIDRKAEELGEPGVGEDDDTKKKSSLRSRLWSRMMGRTAQDDGMSNPMDPSSTANPFSPAQDVNSSMADTNPDMGAAAGSGGAMDPSTEPPDEIAGSATGTAASSHPRAKPSDNPNAPRKPPAPQPQGMPAQMLTGTPMMASIAMVTRAQVAIAETILDNNPGMGENDALRLAGKTIDRYPHLVREAYGGFDFPFGKEDEGSYATCPQCGKDTLDARVGHCHNCGYISNEAGPGWDPISGATTIHPGRADLQNPGIR